MTSNIGTSAGHWYLANISISPLELLSHKVKTTNAIFTANSTNIVSLHSVSDQLNSWFWHG